MKSTIFHLLLLCLLSQLLTNCQPSSAAENTAALPTDLFVGTYTRTEGHVDGKAAGIYHARLTTDSVALLRTQTGIVNPSYLTLHPNGEVLYAVSEIGSPEVDSSGWVYSYHLAGGELALLNRQPTHSFAPCYVSVHPGGQWLYVANYVGGMLVRYPLNGAGEIGPASDTLRLSGSGPTARQEAAHPHSAVLSPDGAWVMVADLGTDRVHTFFADQATWEEATFVQLPAGSGPRHLAFHPAQPYAYVINELNNTVTALHYNAENGALQIKEYYPTLPTDFTEENVSADIHLTPDGRYLYASNRGHNSLAAYAVQPDGGLQSIGHYPTRGDFPRNFVIHPSGAYLLVSNQNTDNIVQFSIDLATGGLTFLREWSVKTPVCLAFEQ
ncbi:MAG: lactonase family protein [Bacteroidota bacterium]